MQGQYILTPPKCYEKLDDFLKNEGVKKIFLVCGDSVGQVRMAVYFSTLEKRTGIKVVRFRDYTANPQYSAVVEGVRLFREEGCDMVAAVGGGSAIDVAKCIKLYSDMEPEQNFLLQTVKRNQTKLLAAPTTAGTGSEATRFAVIYYRGEKQSISDDSCLPAVVVMDPSSLDTLPEYQRKATAMDALCHAMEAFWSVFSNEESRAYSMDAIKRILRYKDLYLVNDRKGKEEMLKASHVAGKSINLAQTTAGHAMCYKLTSLYGIAHGHAAGICVAKLLPYMTSHLDQCIDPRGERYLERRFKELARIMGCQEIDEAASLFAGILDEWGLKAPVLRASEELQLLKTSVNIVRLRNNPICLEPGDIECLYRQIFNV